MSFRPRRSALYVPANNVRAIEKAITLPADVIILDLEDAVPPQAKNEARRNAASAIRSQAFRDKELVLRINGLDSDEAAEDLVVGAGSDAVLVPKVQDANDIHRAEAGLNEIAGKDRPALWAMIETPKAILNIAAIAAVAARDDARLACFVLGTNDLAKDTRVNLTGSRLAMLSWISQTVLAARAYDLAVLDGVYNNLKDPDGYLAECRQGRGFGFDGKTVIHPSQIADANHIFGPTDSEIAEARAIVEAFARPENAGKGVLTVGGRMAELLHRDQAERTLAIARATGLA
ncbi:MAG TPA: CoA ester lyase [Beijerinckiaceae bacterium]|nr:CoA ester lyase [Beijerinckiaceae bacterium]